MSPPFSPTMTGEFHAFPRPIPIHPGRPAAVHPVRRPVTARSLPTPAQADAARRLLALPHGASEDAIRQNVSRLLDSLGIDSILSYRTPAGPADLYLPQRRIFVETKAMDLADHPDKEQSRVRAETPRQQLERYLHSERREELEIHRHSTEDGSSHPWTGVLTDGRVWHAWRYNALSGLREETLHEDLRPSSALDLLARLQPILEGKKVGKPWIPEDCRKLFAPWRDQLQEIYEGLQGRQSRETRTKRELWLQMIRASSLEPENESAMDRLFVTHSFLVALAQGVIHTLGRPGLDPDPESLLEGGFVSWVVAGEIGRQWAGEFLEDVHAYDWRRRPGDVLRPLYEEFVEEKERRDFGEFYTPDWLAELMVEQVLDDGWCERAVAAAIAADRDPGRLRGTGVLDPACGSGTFLYHAVRRILGSSALRRQNLDRVAQAKVAARLVNGIDVHPVAGVIARATVLRALPSEPPGGKAAIQIYQGDSLLLRSRDNTLFQPVNGSILFETPQGQEAILPGSLVDHQEFADLLRRIVESAVDGHPLPEDVRDCVPEKDRAGLEDARRQFADIVRTEGNSVWVWYIVNTTGPFRLESRKVDRIVANPPWLTLSGIQSKERKQALEQFSREQVRVWAGGRVAPHLDIAQLFVKRCRELYLASPRTDPAAWLVKKAAIRSQGWDRFRKWHEGILAQSLDLEEAQPFGGGDARRSCVLFECRPSAGLAEGEARELRAMAGDGRPRAGATCEEALRLLDIRPAARSFPVEASGYCDPGGEPLFRQGATITPKVLTVAGIVLPGSKHDHLQVKTALSRKRPWSGIREQTGEFPEWWLRSLLSSGNLYPFAIAGELPRAVLPLAEDGLRLLKDPSKASQAWQRWEEIYREHRGKGRHTPGTLLGRMDYGRALTLQLGLKGRGRTLVVHPSSGDIMRAARMVPGQAVLDSKIYYLQAATAREAAYLAGILNAPSLNAAFAESRTSGRDFHKNPWRKIPIARYDPENAVHQEIADLAVQAERAVLGLVDEDRSQGQVAISKGMRRVLASKGILDRLDKAAGQALPRHAA